MGPRTERDVPGISKGRWRGRPQLTRDLEIKIRFLPMGPELRAFQSVRKGLPVKYFELQESHLPTIGTRARRSHLVPQGLDE